MGAFPAHCMTTGCRCDSLTGLFNPAANAAVSNTVATIDTERNMELDNVMIFATPIFRTKTQKHC